MRSKQAVNTRQKGMLMQKHLKPVWLMFLLLGISWSAKAQVASHIDYAGTSLGGGLWQYDYTVFNDTYPLALPNATLFDVNFTFDPAVNASVVALPSGWDYIPDTGSIEAFAVDVGAPPIGSEIAPGTSLEGFSLQFDQQVGSIPFTATFTNTADPNTPLTANGTTTPSSVVPEPGRFILFISTFLVGCGVIRRRRWL